MYAGLIMVEAKCCGLINMGWRTHQLIAEVKGIYAGLIMVKAKYCEVDARQRQAVLGSDMHSDIPMHSCMVLAYTAVWF